MGGEILGLFGLPSHWEVLIVILAILLLFGGRKLPELARGLARGLRIFKQELRDAKDSVDQASRDEGEAEKADKPETKDESPGEGADKSADKGAS